MENVYTFKQFLNEDKFEDSLEFPTKWKMGTNWFRRWMTPKKERNGWTWKDDKKFIWITRPGDKDPSIRFDKKKGLVQGDFADQMEMQW